jgi:hypothetical protein
MKVITVQFGYKDSTVQAQIDMDDDADVATEVLIFLGTNSEAISKQIEEMVEST